MLCLKNQNPEEKRNFPLAILKQMVYNTPVTPAGVMGSDPTAACGGVKGGERVAAVSRCQGAPSTQADAGHRNRKAK